MNRMLEPPHVYLVVSPLLVTESGGPYSREAACSSEAHGPEGPVADELLQAPHRAASKAVIGGTNATLRIFLPPWECSSLSGLGAGWWPGEYVCSTASNQVAGGPVRAASSRTARQSTATRRTVIERSSRGLS